MIGYLFLSIALIAGVTKGYCGKRISGKITTLADSALVNTARMFLCIAIGMVLLFAQEGFSSLAVSPTTLLISMLSGVCSALFVISWLFAVKQSAYMMVEVFLLVGTVIPIALSFFAFGEGIRPIQGVGLAILFVAVYIMSTYNVSIKGKMTLGSMLPLIIAGAANGFADFSQKLFGKSGVSDSASAFNLYTYVFAAAVLLIFYIFNRSKSQSTQSENSGFKKLWRLLGYVFVMSVCLYMNSYFKTLASYHIDATELYPLNQGAAVILSLLMSSIFFKEKINLKCIVGICLAFVALMFINLL